MSFLRRYDLFVFDLDGTLVDSREDIAASLNEALAPLGAEPLDVETVTRYVGNGARVLIERALGGEASPERVQAGLDAFLHHYRAGCLDRTRLYPGVRAALEGLCGKTVALLTNKPSFHSLKILAGLGIEGRFRRVVAGDTMPAKKPDPRGLVSILEELSCPPERSLLVGDTAVDVQTARAAGAAAAFVTYGFRPEEAEVERPDHILSSLLDLIA